MARHKKKNKPLWEEGYRKKCSACGSVKKVEHRKVELPMRDNNFNPREERKAVDIKGAVVYHYCSTECAGDSFVNNYTDLDFYNR
jgi:hypothetical protein